MAPLGSRYRSSFNALLRQIGRTVCLSAALLGGLWLGGLLPPLIDSLNRVKLEQRLSESQANAETLTVQIRVEHQLPNGYRDRGSASGVVIHPGVDNNGRILTNGHVCDMMMIPTTMDDLLSMSKEQSLYRPIRGRVIFADGISVAAEKILLNQENPDLCVVQLKGPTPVDGYASVSPSYPTVGERVISVSHPRGGPALPQIGFYRGLDPKIHRPPRTFTPDYINQWMQINNQRLNLLEKRSQIQFLFDYFSLLDHGIEDQEWITFLLFTTLISIDQGLDDLDAVERKLDSPIPAPSVGIHMWGIGGTSGSGIWNSDGQLVALVWGGLRGGGMMSYCVPLVHIEEFLAALPE